MTVYKNNVKIVEARPTGGKAGKKFNKTSTIQVIDDMSNLGYVKLKQFRFNIKDKASKQRALDKAGEYIKDLFPNNSDIAIPNHLK